jgi:hypothetical protein
MENNDRKEMNLRIVDNKLKAILEGAAKAEVNMEEIRLTAKAMEISSEEKDKMVLDIIESIQNVKERVIGYRESIGLK